MPADRTRPNRSLRTPDSFMALSAPSWGKARRGHRRPDDEDGGGAAEQPVGFAARVGVSIALGTDLLGPLHTHPSDEFRLRAQVQPPAEVLKSATSTGARLVGMDRDLPL